MYLANPTGDPRVHDAMRGGAIGFIDTPKQKNKRFDGVPWCADNGCFGKGFKEQHWWAWLVANAPYAGSCLFASAPDVVGDAEATLKRSLPWLPKIRQLGYPAAFVAQDGQEDVPVPWGEFDVLFIGGTDDFKVGPLGLRADGTPRGPVPCAPFVAEARRRGKRVHCGRVNSGKRYVFARVHLGCDSADGTFLTRAPSHNLGRMLRWPLFTEPNLTLNAPEVRLDREVSPADSLNGAR